MPSDAPVGARTDVVVVGAGPAGLAAVSVLLQEPDVHVTVVDAGAGPGGQYWRQPPFNEGLDGVSASSLRGLHHDLDVFDEMAAALAAGEQAGRVELLVGHQAWTAVPDGEGYAVHVASQDRPGRQRALVRWAPVILVAAGAYDRVLPFPGWDLPGVMTAGGLQALLKGNDVLAGRRVAVGGTGPFLLPVAAGLAERGAQVVGVFEANRPGGWLRDPRALALNAGKLAEGLGYAATLARHRVPIRLRTMVTAAHGADRVEAVTTVRLDGDGRGIPGSESRHPVDAVGIGWGFTPSLDLLLTLGCELVTESSGTQGVRVDADQRTSRAGVFAAGEVCGIGGAALAVVEGRLAGAGILSRLGRRGPAASEISGDITTAARLRRFAEAMHAASPVPAGWRDFLSKDTVFCRCEEVPYAAVQAAVSRHGCADARQLKQLTRVGMGWCQGRVCGYAAALVTQGAPGQPEERLVAAPVSLGALASTAEPQVGAGNDV
jgi:D-hydroxyproline dehydrogenase subunit alpha